jgi:hypothetical protein
MLRARVFETAASVEEAHHPMKVLELLMAERLRRVMPERIKKTLKEADGLDIIDLARDEVEDFGEVAELEDRRVKVEPRRTRETEGYQRRSQRYTPSNMVRRCGGG